MPPHHSQLCISAFASAEKPGVTEGSAYLTSVRWPSTLRPAPRAGLSSGTAAGTVQWQLGLCCSPAMGCPGTGHPDTPTTRKLDCPPDTRNRAQVRTGAVPALVLPWRAGLGCRVALAPGGWVPSETTAPTPALVFLGSGKDRYVVYS